MTKITAEHLSRSAVVYVRQSTFYQVMNNLESGRLQYGHMFWLNGRDNWAGVMFK